MERSSQLMIRYFRFVIQKDAYLSQSIRAFCELFADVEGEKRKYK